MRVWRLRKRRAEFTSSTASRYSPAATRLTTVGAKEGDSGTGLALLLLLQERNQKIRVKENPGAGPPWREGWVSGLSPRPRKRSSVASIRSAKRDRT